MNRRNLVCTICLVNVVWFTLGKLAEISLNVLIKEHKTNCEKAELDKSAVAKHAWTYGDRIKWDEANILAIDSHRFSRKMRESIEIEKHNTIDQESKPLDSTWRAKLSSLVLRAHA